MSETELQTAAASQSLDDVGFDLLEQAVSATKQTPRDEAEELMRTLVRAATSGTVTFSRNLTVTLNQAIAALDAKLSRQLAAIMHDPEFLKLEGTWRGLHYLAANTPSSNDLKIRVLNVPKTMLAKDLTKATAFDQSNFFKAIYESEFGTAGGAPYGLLVGDYEFTNHPDDIQLLRDVSQVAAASFAPFIAGASPKLFGFDDYRELSKPTDLAKTFESNEFAKWRSFRETEDARFVTLAMPRVLARLPYGAETKPIEEFGYEEAPSDAAGNAKPMGHDEYCWMNASFVMASRITNAFGEYGWCTAIRGAENGGKVENLPTHNFTSDDGDLDTKCPTEIAITDRREAELSKLGFLPLCHYKNTDYAVFFGAQTTQKPKKYDSPAATENAAISARLPYLLATSRFAHYLKVMARDKIGSFLEVEDAERWLNRWISNYVNANDKASAETKARYPLREAKVEVKEVPGQPGVYNAVAYMRPWLQMEELTTSLRMVARIPKKA
ncbi:MAG: type VI secretion system contractile sheath large subunit [Alphaproteobacteria bacterium]|nr:type VI secretion system contractile sheath large subunit [Alphaproteobacteria bacterium]